MVTREMITSTAILYTMANDESNQLTAADKPGGPRNREKADRLQQTLFAQVREYLAKQREQ